MISRLDGFFDHDNHLENNTENNAWDLEHYQQILNRTMKGIMSIITSTTSLVTNDGISEYVATYIRN